METRLNKTRDRIMTRQIERNLNAERVANNAKLVTLLAQCKENRRQGLVDLLGALKASLKVAA